MFKCKQFPDREFKSQDDMFKHLRENADKIISVKKATIYKSVEKGIHEIFLLDKTLAISKGIHMKDDCIYPVINTTMVMDHYDDVHINGCSKKTAKEQNGKIFYMMDHKTGVDNVIAWPSDVNIMVKSVPWAFLNAPYEGDTEAFMFEISKSEIVHPVAKDIIDKKRPVQNSISMQYIQVWLAMNSKAKEDEVYLKRYDQWIEQIANKDQVKEQGYFFGVEELAIRNEGSMVLRGANYITPIKEKSDAVHGDTSDKTDAGKSTFKYFNPHLFN